ncbi:acetolactate synthase small subunit [Helicobacter sp. 13S00401-1]|uniref:acetolactate synthase small subunit n=1 Tax=Helicobacter sp. 13S00401-1 TaxID=1905758 RepID=UPI000BA623B8|nr:acetolactate synthase small subunit [Helicobacter sp. 13S00401-1]PAF51369.1 acetolactate synthase small subunit [Helicobacter sp. 13S00401-1]
MQKRVISLTVLNEHSVLARISGLFAGRGYNIESLTVAPLMDGNFSYVSISTRGDEKVLEQIIKQLHKLIPVVSVGESEDVITEELALLKFEINENLETIKSLISYCNHHIVSMSSKYIVFSVSDTPKKISELKNTLKQFNPKDMIRSGVVVMDKN